MNTLAEIESVLPSLTLEELRHLDEVIQVRLTDGSVFITRPKVLTAWEARNWWEEVERFSAEEGEAFAKDIEAGRSLTNQPPSDRWAS